MFSARFARPVVLTNHALRRMAERGITEHEVLPVIDTGETRFADERRLWAYK